MTWIHTILESAHQRYTSENSVKPRQKGPLKVKIDRSHSPMTWVRMILEGTQQRSNGIVEQHLIGASLERRFNSIPVPNHPEPIGDGQTAREADFLIGELVYHVTTAPSRTTTRKCAASVKGGLHPVLVTPCRQENKAQILAEVRRINKKLTIVSLEAVVSTIIIQLATEESKAFFSVLQEIVQIYNRRLAEVETDLSLQIQLS
ncbi:MAG: DUF4928 family protein [Candidatus Binatia bacterium]